jgi:6-pyruvoyltetrahydropterin/6-carboxytetrahydropterin synthase
MKVTISRKAHFNSHRLYRKDWTFEKTMLFLESAIIRIITVTNELIVGVTGHIDPETGYVMDVKILSDLIKEEVENRFDHKI